MLKKYIIIYPVDNKLVIATKKETEEIEFNNEELKYGKISKPNEFIKQFEFKTKRLKLKKGLLVPYIIFIANATYNDADIELTKNTIESLGFIQYKIVFENALLDFKKGLFYIVCNNTHLYIINKKSNKEVEVLNYEYSLFNDNPNKIIDLIKQNKRLITPILLGYYKNIVKINKELKRQFNNAFVLENPDTYFIKKAKDTL